MILPAWMRLLLLAVCVAWLVLPRSFRRTQRRSAQRRLLVAQRHAANVLDAAGRPRWCEIAHDVRCARCEYNLRGIQEPRCPECGIVFDWSEVIDPTARRVPWLFEHHWADDPARSFLLTAYRALLPWKLWRELRFTDRASAGALLLYAIFWSVLLLIADEVWLHRFGLASGFGAPGGGDRYLITLLGVCQWMRLDAVAGYRIGLLLLAWMFGGLTLVSLLVFRQTMGRCRIRFVQVLRLVVYAMTCLILAPVVGVVWPWIDAMLAPRSLAAATIVTAAVSILRIGAWILLCVSLAVGLHRYLKVRRGWLMVVASQVIVLLAMMNLFLLRL